MPPVARSADRIESEQAVAAELQAWRESVVPDPSASFDADALARLVGACLAALGVEAEAGAGFTVNTVHYYRRKNILDEPAGRTSAARYGVHHLWQAIGARLAGHLGLVTLAEARDAMRGASEETLLAFVAARVVDARARERLRFTTAGPAPLARVRATVTTSMPRARPLPGVVSAVRPAAKEPAPSVVIALPGDAWCIVPAAHPAHRSASSARELVHALASALRVQLR